jgi:hypothetical protein
LAQQFEIERTVCQGERQKADLSGTVIAGGGLAGLAAAQQRANSADQVVAGCMAEKGYLLVREDQAEEKRQELAAVPAEKARRDASSRQQTTAARNR